MNWFYSEHLKVLKGVENYCVWIDVPGREINWKWMNDGPIYDDFCRAYVSFQTSLELWIGAIEDWKRGE